MGDAINIHVQDDAFSKTSLEKKTGTELKFISDRNAPVTISFSPSGFFSGTDANDQITLGTRGAEKKVTIAAATGSGQYRAPQASSASPRQDDGDIKGDVKVNTSR